MSVTEPLFLRALANVRKTVDSTTDALARCEGVDAALVMAAAGVPVAPLDKKTLDPLGEPSTDLARVAASFAGLKTALVGYNSCEAPFYCLVTDSLHDLKSKLVTEPALRPVAALFGRVGGSLPGGTGHPFEHVVALFGRKAGDRFETLFVEGRGPLGGSVLLAAGWMEGSEPAGCRNDGWLPVPAALLREVAEDPQLAFWLAGPKDAPRFSVH